METKRDFPKVGNFWKMLGPSFLILAMGLGSGEVILWPYLVSKYGMGVAWGALLGITMQFFMNMEIERYALIKGESVFVGLYRKFRWTAVWFILSTFIGFGLPGIISASAKIIGTVFGVSEFKYIAMAMLVLIGVLLTASRTVYKSMENITKFLILFCVPLVFVLAVLTSDADTWRALWSGLVGIGDGYFFLPAGISIATFLAALAYSGAGGNLNLTQSVYIKEKGYGMGAYSQKISGLLRSRTGEKINLEGVGFEDTEENKRNFLNWWKLINKEHLLVFWFMGIVSMILLMVLSFNTTYGIGVGLSGIDFVIAQGEVVGGILGSVWGVGLLAILGVLLFQTQLGIVDSTSRIMGECLALTVTGLKKDKEVNLSAYYFGFVWSQILFGVTLFLLNIYEPKTLIVLGAVINAFAMVVHTLLVRILNGEFKGVYATSIVRVVFIWMIIAFFAGFSLFNVFSSFSK